MVSLRTSLINRGTNKHATSKKNEEDEEAARTFSKAKFEKGKETE